MTTSENSTMMCAYAFAAVRFDSATNHHSLHATSRFEKDTVIVPFKAASTQPVASYLTVQIDLQKHITLQPTILQFVNHSCEPNVFFNTSTMEFTSLRSIAQGDELCFFYPSTEWDMAQPFECFCGRPNCLKEIKGAAYLPPEILMKYKLTDFILRELNTRVEQAF
ncbi:MAG: SET domain-containing protein-lysine N-methyltransferase [Bacteroidota bacterium]